MKKMIMFFLFFLLGATVIALLHFFVGSTSQAKEVRWGVNFSAKHAAALGLNWQVVYTALLDELQVKRLKVSLDWDSLESERGTFSFANADWFVAEAEQRNAQLILVVGMKTMRWPECHLPEWAKGLPKEEQQQEILELLEALVARYKDAPALAKWQVENEPLFKFGDCPWVDRKFLEKEVELVKSLDADHPIVMSDSGELSFWIRAARIGDVVSTTMYRKVWFHEIDRYVTYPLPAVFYARKAGYIDTFFGKEVIVGELQAEPWGPGRLLYDTTMEEQDRAFDMAQFQKNIEFARQTGMQEFYLWGAEWWYWRKENGNDDSFWTEARKLFIQ